MREDVARDDHVRLVAVHRQPVHAQELRQQRVAMTLHDELRQRRQETVVNIMDVSLFPLFSVFRSRCTEMVEGKQKNTDFLLRGIK